MAAKRTAGVRSITDDEQRRAKALELAVAWAAGPNGRWSELVEVAKRFEAFLAFGEPLE